LLNVPGGEEAEDIEEQKRYKMVNSIFNNEPY
jgi:hypothetical protein